MGVTSLRGDLELLAHDDDRSLQAVQLYDLGVAGSAAEVLLGDIPQGVAFLDGVHDIFSLGCGNKLEVVHSYPSHDTRYDAAALLSNFLAEQDAGLSALGERLTVHGYLRDDVIVVGLHPVGDWPYGGGPWRRSALSLHRHSGLG